MSLAQRIASAASPQLMWANILLGCCVILIVSSLLILFLAWRRHFTPLLLVCVLLSLAGVVVAAVVVHHFYQTYSYWVAYLPAFVDESHAAPTFAQVINQFNNDNRMATILGWTGVAVTAGLLALGALGIMRLEAAAGGWSPELAPAE